MRKKYTKLYFERYAILTMALYFNKEMRFFVQSDCPDIQTTDYSLGIEVTQALGLHEYGKDLKYVYADPSQMQRLARRDFLEIDKAIERKIKKCRHYLSYPCNVLYIFTHYGGYEKTEVEAFFKKQKIESAFFEMYILNAIHGLYIYHVKSHYVEYFAFSEKQLKTMHWSAIEYEKQTLQHEKK